MAFKITATVREAATQDEAFYISAYDFHFIGADSSPYESAFIAFEPTLAAEIYAGGSTSGYVSGQVKKGDSILVVYKGGNWKNVFFFVEKRINKWKKWMLGLTMTGVLVATCDDETSDKKEKNDEI